jgi:hypothetical protein
MNIPNVPSSKIVDPDGNPTSIEQLFRQQLISELQDNASNEGLVAPSQPTTNITSIQNNQLANGEFTCGGGRFIYDSTTNTMKVSI